MIPEAYQQARKQMAMLAPRPLHVEETGETDRIAGYAVRRVVVEAGGPGEPFTTRMNLWVSGDLWKELEGTAFWALTRDRLRENFRSAWLADVLAGLEAVILKSESWIEGRDERTGTSTCARSRGSKRTSRSRTSATRFPRATGSAKSGYGPVGSRAAVTPARTLRASVTALPSLVLLKKA